MNECIFCNRHDLKLKNIYKYFFSTLDKFPVTEGHTLIITKRHISSYFDLTKEELNELSNILIEEKLLLEKFDNIIKGFNIGINQGSLAGQTIMHCHIHLIPRRKNDVANPTGGVRGVIPSKQNYKA
jgi:ATP adenylyltransferase